MKKIIILFALFSITLHGQIKVGDSIPTFTLLDANNTQVTSTVFKQKYLLIDFWASWCAPCRVGNKRLVKLFDTIDKRKIDIVGISLDTDKVKWVKAIEKDRIKFPQLNDSGGFDAKIAILFGVEELPSQFLFNEKGILIAKNPTEDQIINYLK